MKKLIIVVLSIMVFPLISQASFDTNFKYGSRDERIKEIQEFLTDQGLYSGPITGNYYSLTRKAVIAFQTRENISPAYGFWGALTRTKANSIKDLDDQNENSQELSETGTISNGDNDVCANIEGIQTTVPSGMLTDSLKNCAVPVVQQNVVVPPDNSIQTPLINKSLVVTPTCPIVEGVPTTITVDLYVDGMKYDDIYTLYMDDYDGRNIFTLNGNTSASIPNTVPVQYYKHTVLSNFIWMARKGNEVFTLKDSNIVKTLDIPTCTVQ